MMTSILQRTLTPLLVAVIWIVAIFTMASEPVGGLEPLLAGLMGGAACLLQAFAVGAGGGRIEVLGLKASVVAGGALLIFVCGAALSLAADPVRAARPFYQYGQIAISLAGISSFLIRLGIALAFAAIVAQSSLALLGRMRSPS